MGLTFSVRVQYLILKKYTWINWPLNILYRAVNLSTNMYYIANENLRILQQKKREPKQF